MTLNMTLSIERPGGSLHLHRYNDPDDPDVVVLTVEETYGKRSKSVGFGLTDTEIREVIDYLKHCIGELEYTAVRT